MTDMRHCGHEWCSCGCYGRPHCKMACGMDRPREPEPGDSFVEGWVDRGDYGPMEVVTYFPWSPHYATVSEAIAEGRKRVVVHDPLPFGTPSFVMQRLTRGVVPEPS